MTDKTSYVDTTEFAKIINISSSTIAKYLREGKIKGKKVAGKWMISKNELENPFIQNLLNQIKPDKAQQSELIAKKTYSVSEFSKITYLTEKGVLDWLKKGLIKGDRSADGNWSIDETNLEIPNIKRLIRDAGKK